MRGVTAADGAFRTRGFLGDYEVEVTVNGVTKTYPLTLASNTEPAFVNIGKTAAGAIAANGIVNAASLSRRQRRARARSSRSSAPASARPSLAAAQYVDGRLPTSVGETRVLFDGVAAPMIYAVAGQVSAIVPYAVKASTQVQVEYQGVATAPSLCPSPPRSPGIFACPNKPGVALVINASAGGVISCNDNFVPPAPGSVVTFFVTGDGVPTPAIADGRLPAGPAVSRPAHLERQLRRRRRSALRRHLRRPGLRRRHAGQRLCPARRAPRTGPLAVAFLPDVLTRATYTDKSEFQRAL